MITSDEVNYLIYRYLVESGFTHSTFTFQYESALHKRNIKGSHIKPGALINLLQKGLLYAELECHVSEDGTETPCVAPFNLLEEHQCATVIENNDKAGSRPNKRPRRDDGLSQSRKDKKDDKKLKKSERDAKSPRKGSVANHSTTSPADDMDLDSNPMDDLNVTKLAAAAPVSLCAWNISKPLLLASGSEDGKVCLWNIPGKSSRQTSNEIDQKAELPMGENSDSPISALQWNPSGSLLAAGTMDGKTFVWSRSGELKYFEKLHEGPVSSLAWNPAGTFIATGSTDKTSVIWDVETANPRQRQRFEFHDGPVLSVDWLDDITFATSSVDAQIYVCQLGHIEPLQQYSHDAEVNKVAWDPTRKYLASCSNDNTLKVWTMESDKPIWTGKGHQKDVTSLAWHPDGDAMLLITVSIDHTARLWDVSKRECQHVFRGHDADVTWAEFSPDGRHIATASRDRTLKLWWSNKEHGLIKSYQDEKAHSVVQARWNYAGDKVALICGTTSVSVLDLSEVLHQL